MRNAITVKRLAFIIASCVFISHLFAMIFIVDDKALDIPQVYQDLFNKNKKDFYVRMYLSFWMFCWIAGSKYDDWICRLCVGLCQEWSLFFAASWQVGLNMSDWGQRELLFFISTTIITFITLFWMDKINRFVARFLSNILGNSNLKL